MTIPRMYANLGNLRVTLKRLPAGYHFIQQRTEAEDIGARIDLLPFGLLRRHVGGRAHDHSARGLSPSVLWLRVRRRRAPSWLSLHSILQGRHSIANVIGCSGSSFL